MLDGGKGWGCIRAVCSNCGRDNLTRPPTPAERKTAGAVKGNPESDGIHWEQVEETARLDLQAIAAGATVRDLALDRKAWTKRRDRLLGLMNGHNGNGHNGNGHMAELPGWMTGPADMSAPIYAVGQQMAML